MEKTLFDTVTDGGKYAPFGLPKTEELTGRTALLPEGPAVRFGETLAVKCDDDLFLAEEGGRLLLAEELPDESLKALDAANTALGAAALPEALEGWETELCFASGYVLTAVFRDGSLTLSPSPEPTLPGAPAPDEAAPAAPGETFALKAAEVGENRFLLHFPETGETVLLNARRYLLYAILKGRIVAGFAELPAR